MFQYVLFTYTCFVICASMRHTRGICNGTVPKGLDGGGSGLSSFPAVDDVDGPAKFEAPVDISMVKWR